MRTYTFRRLGAGFMVGWLLCLITGAALAQPATPPIPTTPYTREFLTNSTAAGARATLQLAGTNVGVLLEFDTTQFQTNDNILRLTNGVPFTNAQSWGALTHDGATATFQNSSLSGGPTVAVGDTITLQGATGQINATNVYVSMEVAPDANQLVWRDWVYAHVGPTVTAGSGTNALQFGATGWGDLGEDGWGVIVVTNEAGVVSWQKADGTVIQSYNPTNIVFGLPIVGDGAGLTNLPVAGIAAGTNMVAVTNSGTITLNSSGLAGWKLVPGNTNWYYLPDNSGLEVFRSRDTDAFTDRALYLGNEEIYKAINLQVGNSNIYGLQTTNEDYPRISMSFGWDADDHALQTRWTPWGWEDFHTNRIIGYDLYANDHKITLGRTNNDAVVTVAGSLVVGAASITNGIFHGDGSGLDQVPYALSLFNETGSGGAVEFDGTRWQGDFGGTFTGSFTATPTDTTPSFKASSTNAVILKCPDGGSWILRIGNNGTLSTVTNTSAL